ncbi:STAS domain-containing protein [Robertmurraya beringensis]|uniref:STAS domain-containing protein n=1 Tax=Robertmurraya beringensis TaxID=641660 RepID=A0ABV6KSN6_9BACI
MFLILDMTDHLVKDSIAIVVMRDETYESVILSLKGVGYINSAGLGVIADAVMQARKQGKELVVANIQGPISEIFEIVKFGSFIHLFATEEEATHFLRNK